jgi:D-arabinose 1-dehydrogenase-like Zn-dependent alcohol dehydrogenase
VRVFLAGATGVIGIRLVAILVADGHTVAGMTRSEHKSATLRELGAEPVICDVYDPEAARRSDVGRLLAQSIAWDPGEDGAAAKHELEHAVLDFGGVVIRCGQLYVPGTYYERELPPHPRVHVDEAARRTMKALGLERTIVTIAEPVAPAGDARSAA